MDIAIPEEALTKRTLDRKVHRRLINDIESVSKAANIPVPMVWSSMHDHCESPEIEYVKHLRVRSAEGYAGLVFLGAEPKKEMGRRMQAIAAACLRNYINAKVMTLQDVLDAIKTSSMPRPTVLLIPNFFVGENDGGKIADWQLSGLLSMVYSRQAEGLQTFLYVKSLNELKHAYGAPFEQNIRSTFVLVSED